MFLFCEEWIVVQGQAPSSEACSYCCCDFCCDCLLSVVVNKNAKTVR
jgi:hypothetical protein